jgi:endoglucanase
MNRFRLAALIVSFLAAPASAAQLGVNLSGGEASTGNLPGKIFTNYTYPTRGDVDLAYSKGARLFRIPIVVDRIQNGFNGPLYPQVAANLYPIIDYIRSKSGAIVILDWHNYGKRLGVVYGTGAWDDAAIADANIKLLAPYKAASANVWVDLQNEPGSPPNYWATQNSVIKKLRAAGYAGTVVVESTGYSNASAWASTASPNIASITDPLKKVVFSPHQYFDANASGTSSACTAGSETRVDPAISDAQKRGYKILFGEVGWGNGANCASVRSAVLKRFAASTSVIGFTAWTLGSWYVYPNYAFGLRSSAGSTSVLFDSLLADWNSASLLM